MVFRRRVKQSIVSLCMKLSKWGSCNGGHQGSEERSPGWPAGCWKQTVAMNTGVMGTRVLERLESPTTGFHRQRGRTDFFVQGFVDKVRLTWDNGSVINSTTKYVKTGRKKGWVWEEVSVKYLQRLGRQLEPRVGLRCQIIGFTHTAVNVSR